MRASENNTGGTSMALSLSLPPPSPVIRSNYSCWPLLIELRNKSAYNRALNGGLRNDFLK